MGTSVTADTRKPFMLSFLAMPGFEHYDCVIKSPSTTNHGHFASGSKHNTQRAPPKRSPTVTPRKKAESVRIAYVKHHIQSFPIVDSHNKRKNTQRQFLEPG